MGRPGIACAGERAPADRARCGCVPVRRPRRTARCQAGPCGEPVAPPAPPLLGRSGTHLGRRQARADPRRPEPGAGPTVRGLVRGRRQPGGTAGPGIRPSRRRARGGGVAFRGRHAARRPGRLPASGCGAVRRPGGRRHPRVPLARHAAGSGRTPGLAHVRHLRRRRARLGTARRGRADPDGGPRARPAPARRRSAGHRRHRDRPVRARGRRRQPARPLARRVVPPVLVHRAAGAQRSTARLPARRGPISRRGDLHRRQALRHSGVRRVQLPRPAHGDDGDRRRRGRRQRRRDARDAAASRVPTACRAPP